MSKYAETHALALAIHATKALATTPEAEALFVALTGKLAQFVDASPTMYTGQRFAEVALFGAPQGKPMPEAVKAQFAAKRGQAPVTQGQDEAKAPRKGRRPAAKAAPTDKRAAVRELLKLVNG